MKYNSTCPRCLGYMITHPEQDNWLKCPSCAYCRKVKRMNLTLSRTETTSEGTFGELKDENNKVIAYTAEHAYEQPDGSWAPKTPVGTYTCQKGQHQLHSMKVPFTTYEITNVPGHSNILLHMGNWPQVDSDGCVLLGDAITSSSKGKMVTNSKVVFAQFIVLQDGIGSFQLVIE